MSNQFMKGSHNHKGSTKYAAALKQQQKQSLEVDRNNRAEFAKVTHKLLTLVTENNFDYNSKVVEEGYIKLNLLWKAYSRMLINKNLNLYNTKAKRVNLIFALEAFYTGLKNQK